MSDVTWQDEVDLLVLGTGAGGLAAAVTGANEGLSVLVLEKTEFVGGTTAYSAGTCWIPGNRYQQADGVADDVPEASRYLDALVGDRAPRELREAYLARGGEMVEYLDRVGVRFWHSKKVVDYHLEIPGSARGRALEPQTFDGRTLGMEGFGRIRPPVPSSTGPSRIPSSSFTSGLRTISVPPNSANSGTGGRIRPKPSVPSVRPSKVCGSSARPRAEPGISGW